MTFDYKLYFLILTSVLVTKPWELMEKTENFLGIENRITKENFKITDERGVPCFIESQREDCLGSGKGRSLEKHFDPQEKVSYKLKDHQKKFFQRLIFLKNL